MSVARIIIISILAVLGIGTIYLYTIPPSAVPTAAPPAHVETEHTVATPTSTKQVTTTLATPTPRTITTCQTTRTDRSRLLLSNRTNTFQYIAHTLGTTPNGHSGTNTKEAFEHSYTKGFRLFEADFLPTKDGHIIVAHDKHEGYWQLFSKFHETSYEDLENARFMGIYMTLDVYDLLELMQSYPDTIVVIDIKFTSGEAYDEILHKIITAGIEVLGIQETFDRFIPQIYFPEDITRNPTICQFTDIMFTQYRNNISWSDAYRFLQSTPGVTALVTHYEQRYKEHMQLDMARINKPVYVHPVRSSTLQDVLIQQGLGIFTSVSTTIE